MKMARNMMLAICLGVIGGFAVTILSYYNQHKQGGIANTLFAVADSARTIREAYSGTADAGYNWNVDSNLLAGGRLSSMTGEYIDDRIPALSDSVQAAFRNIGISDSVTEVIEELGTGAYDDAIPRSTDISSLLGTVFQSEHGDTDLLAVNSGVQVENPYGDILRFHVRANSDSDQDQALKLAVKEDVVAMLKPLLADCGSVAESKEIVVNNLQNIYTTAVNTITEEGYDYPVKVYVTVEEFPAKTYGDLTFPEGKYQALRVDIGNALGQNWWCVMYPPLCFIDDATAVVSDEGKEILKENLSPAEYEALLNDPETQLKGESLIYNKLKEWIDRVRG